MDGARTPGTGEDRRASGLLAAGPRLARRRSPVATPLVVATTTGLLYSVTGALVTQLANILKARIYGAPPAHPSGDMDASLRSLLHDHPMVQPLIFSVITQFSDKENSVELPLMIFFDRDTFDKIIDIIRTYDFMGGQQLGA